MAKEKNTEKNTEKKEVLTIASVFQKLGTLGAKSRKDLAEKIIKYLASKGMTENVKGKTIRLERVTQQISAMVRDIGNKRGAKTNSWWSQFTVQEDKDGIKLVKSA